MDIDYYPNILKTLKSELTARYKVKEIGVFGSFVRGDQKQDSDLDLLVDFEDNADLFDMMGLANHLEQALGREVDIVPKRALRQELLPTVMNEMIIV